jgi:hypothetical protein
MLQLFRVPTDGGKTMFGKSIPSGTAAPSFFYLLMAATCFQRAGRARHPNARGALRHIGCEYLAQASPNAVAAGPGSKCLA